MPGLKTAGLSVTPDDQGDLSLLNSPVPIVRHALQRETIHWIASVSASSSTCHHALRFSRGWFLGRSDTNVIQAYTLAVHINWVRHAYLAL